MYVFTHVTLLCTSFELFTRDQVGLKRTQRNLLYFLCEDFLLSQTNCPVGCNINLP